MNVRRATTALAIGALLLAPASMARAQDTATAEMVDTTQLRICADPNSLPYSNEKLEGFENRIASLLGKELGIPVTYTWYPNTTGFIRNTLAALKCDLIMGVTSVNELLQNSNPYYTSTYAFVQREDIDTTITSFDDPALRDMTIGVVARTPPVTVLANRNLLDRMRSYALEADSRYHAPVQDLLHDVARGIVDVGIVWGPIAGYWSEHVDAPLKVTPIVGSPDGVRMQFNISMGLRHGEPDWKHRINTLIRRNQAEINAVLQEYRTPLIDRQGKLIPTAEGSPSDPATGKAG
ncbi:substrate-binding domain-containing protein [Marinivivus vitaminiproducens]|uniref:substrate-binding domain-containing protein n=1 Tax=Marinivivus vitaminiproducens TaxID=3035935 RepID=UPI0027A8293F|nr:substrate-binding domain-containing protein [Geminicoccaceae bacterium SCSIO 64248]